MNVWTLVTDALLQSLVIVGATMLLLAFAMLGNSEWWEGVARVARKQFPANLSDMRYYLTCGLGCCALAGLYAFLFAMYQWRPEFIPIAIFCGIGVAFFLVGAGVGGGVFIRSWWQCRQILRRAGLIDS